MTYTGSMLFCGAVGLFCLTAGFKAGAQVTMQAGYQLNASGQPIMENMVVYGSEGLARTITYKDIKGHPYWNYEAAPALLYGRNNVLLGKVMARLNQYTHELHFQDSTGKELAADNLVVNKVAWLDPKDESKVIAVFRNDFAPINQKIGKPVFAQVLSDESGDYKFLKTRVYKIGTYDSVVGTRRGWMFTAQDDYHLYRKGVADSFRKLSKEKIDAFVRDNGQKDAFIREQKLDMRKEKDVVRLINHVNQTEN